MQKIMFNDKSLLTKAVLEGRKTQTRRIIKSYDAFERVNTDFDWDKEDITNWNNSFTQTFQNMSKDEQGKCLEYLLSYSKYKIGETVAIAQRYEDVWIENASAYHNPYFRSGLPGWKNKMFVKASDMPHQIKITNVWIERLQDISDENCLKEGVIEVRSKDDTYSQYYVSAKGMKLGACFENPKDAFAYLINDVSRKDVWNENPYVFVYEFELVK